MIPLAFIWRIHRHTTGMNHKHVEAFQRPGGWREGRALEEEGSVALTGAPCSTLLSSGLFQAGRKRRGVRVFCCFFSHSLAQLSCGFAELPFVDSCTHIRYRRPLICLTGLIEMCITAVLIPIDAS